MFKVLIWGMEDNPGGVESVIMNYYRNIDNNVCQFIFVSPSPQIAYENEILSRGDIVIHIPSRRKHFFKFRKALNNLFKQYKFDAIWANMCSLSNIDCLKFATKHNIKTRIIHSHNSQNMGSFISAILHKINRKFIHRYANNFWACGKLAGEYFYNPTILNSTNYKIIPNAIDLQKFKFDDVVRNNIRSQLDAEDKLIFGHVGRFHFQKNHKFLIEVFYEFQKKYSNCELQLVGQGEDEHAIKQQVKELAIEDKVKFLGVRNNVNELLQGFDLIVLPSLFEGLSVALLEAQATGLPIYASNTISTETKVNNNFTFLSLTQSPAEWANYIYNNISNITRDDNALNNLKQIGFDISTQVNNFVNLLQGR
jgi:glycosyltransferase involved in cell wall biosynthesis